MPAYKDKNGKWKIKLSYISWDNKRKWLTKRGFDTKRAALQWEKEFYRKNDSSLKMTLISFSEVYFENLENRIKPDTYYEKKAIFTKWINPFLGTKKINSISSSDVLKWHNMLLKHTNKEGKKLSKSYLKTIHNQLSAILNYAVKYYDLPKNPASIVGNLGTDREVKNDYWTEEEFQLFLEAESDEPMYYYAFEVLFWLGIREGELLALTKKDIDFESGCIHIDKTYYVLNGKPIVTSPKTIDSIRVVYAPEFLIQDLKDYLKMIYNPKDSDRIFPLSKTMLNRHLKRGAKKAGIKAIRVHDLRHSHVSLLINMGISPLEIAKRVGHKNTYITYHYAHLFPGTQESIAGKLNDKRENLIDDDDREKEDKK